jgi:Na+/melibiose symporter-like transporter
LRPDPNAPNAHNAHPRWPALEPFHTRSFRTQWPADLCTAWALEMEVLILGWYVLVESGSVVLLTLFGALMYVGTLLAPLMGTLGDRLGLRRVLAGMRFSYAALAAVILWLAATQRLEPSWVLAVAFVVGLIKPTDIGMRTALVSASVPQTQLVAAMGISRTTQDSARIGGALAGAGFMASLGLVSAYIAITALYVLGAVLTTRSGRRGQKAQNSLGGPSGPPVASAWRELKDGLLYVWRTPPLRAAMALAALVNLCLFPFSSGLMPYIAKDVFQLDQRGLGWLVASYAAGALFGSLALSAWGARLRPGRTMLVGCVLWHLCLLGLALPVSVGVAAALYLAAGLNQSLSMVSLSVILMRHSQPQLRGRVMGIRMLAIYTLPIGLLGAGALIPRFSFQAVVSLYVGLGLFLTAWMAWVWRHELWSATAPANAR